MPGTRMLLAIALFAPESLRPKRAIRGRHSELSRKPRSNCSGQATLGFLVANLERGSSPRCARDLLWYGVSARRMRLNLRPKCTV